MRNTTKMMALTMAADRGRTGNDRAEMTMPYMGGHERHGNGYYAPRNESTGTLTWDTTHDAERANRGGYGRSNMRYDYGRSEMDEPEARRRRDSRGRFRSEMDRTEESRAGMNYGEMNRPEMNRTEMHYSEPNYPPPVYEAPHRIGFAAHDGSERMNQNGLHMIRGGADHRAMKMDEETAREWMANLQNEDGTKGPHWTMEQVKQLLAQKNWNEDPVRAWVAINAMYSDYCGVAKKVNANNIDFYVNMAKAFLDDKDAVGDKLSAYYEYVVK